MLSIIIPVFNGEKHLSACLQSVVEQPEESLEIIVVDDGSWDRTAAIIQDYARRDDRIVMVKKPNGGVSSARNAGIRVASGIYIWFVDSDDWLEPGAVKILTAVTADREYDTVMFSYNIADYDDTVSPPRRPGLQDGQVFEQQDRDMVLKRLLSDNLINVWRSIFRTDFIRERCLSFDEDQRNAEDVLFVFKVWSVCCSGLYIDRSLYCYRKTPGSLTRSFHPYQYTNSQRARSLVFKATEHLWPEDFRKTYADWYVRFTLKYMMRLFHTYKDYDKKGRRASLESILSDDVFQAFAARTRCRDLGLIWGLELWLARKKMTGTIWFFNSCIHSSWARNMNRLLGIKLQ